MDHMFIVLMQKVPIDPEGIVCDDADLIG